MYRPMQILRKLHCMRALECQFLGIGPTREHRFLISTNNVLIFHAAVTEMGIYFSNNEITTKVNAK